MMNRAVRFLSSISLLFCCDLLADESRSQYQELLSLETTGADAFVKKHPDWNGKGVVIAILDSGVDMSVPGLTRTPDGEIKVIEARDFTGQGVVKLEKPEKAAEGDEEIWKTRDGVVRGVAGLNPAPEVDSLLLGFVTEEAMKNSDVSDINDDGRTDGAFALLVGKTAEGLVFWVDGDGDGHLDDEKALHDYGERQEFFTFGTRLDDGSRPPMAFAAHLDPEKSEVELHFADGSHGTHVAGIAAGYRLFDKDSYNGIAPGAKVLSLKIGDNTLSGGCTRSRSMLDALEFAAKWSKDKDVPVVANMSYGIGSENEGSSDIEDQVDRLLATYPNLAVAISAGNAGPGLSTVGTPAGAKFAFTSGALLTRRNGAALYSMKLAEDVVFWFSSCGGELPKPDGLTPGAAASSVPPWEWGAVMKGTSMASPQAAGCLALLASAARQKGLFFHGALLAAALRNSGKPLPGWSLPEQGAGVVNVPRAFELLGKLSALPFSKTVAGFVVEAPSPYLPEAKGPALFLRTGSWLPKGDLEIDVRPVFFTESKAQDRERFFEDFDLFAEPDWLELASSSVFLKKDEGGLFKLRLLADRLKTPGLYSGRIFAVPRGQGRRPELRVFELWATVLVPELPGLGGKGLDLDLGPVKVAPGRLVRRFVRVPEGAGAMTARIEPLSGENAMGRLRLFDPAGHEAGWGDSVAELKAKRTGGLRVDDDEILPGTWEIDVEGMPDGRGDGVFRLTVAISGLSAKLPDSFQFDFGEKPRAEFKLRARLDDTFEGRADGEVSGYHRSSRQKVSQDSFEQQFTVDASVEGVEFVLSMSAKDYGRFTDVAINIKNAAGEVVEKDGFVARKARISMSGATAGQYTLQVIGAFADRPADWDLKIVEKVTLRQRPKLDLFCEGASFFTVYPFSSRDCEVELRQPPLALPAGFSYWGTLRFVEDRTNELILRKDFSFTINQGD